jgi:hypothetical protein
MAPDGQLLLAAATPVLMVVAPALQEPYNMLT